jgi:integrase
MDIRRDSLVLPNLKNPSRPTKRVFLPAGQMDLPGVLLLWAKEHGLADDEPLFFSRKRTAGGALRSISRQQAWQIVRAASERAHVRVLALRASAFGKAGESAPVHPHLFRHARVRQIVRSTRNLPLAQRQAGWSRLQTAYLTLGEEEARQLMQEVAD